jgi:hypothetical protein
MSHRTVLGGAAAVILLAGCFHATIETGLAPSNQVIEKPWASGWIFGLVAPSPVETMSKCPSGVSKVETQLSFVNMLVAFITFDIYTPMAIKVTCATGGHSMIPPGAARIDAGADPTAAQLQDALTTAVKQSAQSGQPVYIER